ncbi:MAG: TetR/AcrR family transcriptional regulator [Alphaproteobacteria bacterium]|jgi:AcrR family transcriptional regulator|nr:TetR/AcrR family transcriptional regulator [Alphaproteobacteria bacterium]HJP20559.1 TetR/AcrR family transcriptional regulator [Alphaproteobacteria bacterium]
MAQTAAPSRRRRTDSRRRELLDEAAWLFRQKGYHATSVRDVCSAVGMLPGSLYSHFASKEELLVAVYEVGIAEISQAVASAVADADGPWERFEAACTAHLEALLKSSDYPQVVVRVLPDDAPGAKDQLVALRDSYDAIFVPLMTELPLADPGADRGFLLRLVIGALNSTTTWFRPTGDSPRTIARKFVATLREAAE